MKYIKYRKENYENFKNTLKGMKVNILPNPLYSKTYNCETLPAPESQTHIRMGIEISKQEFLSITGLSEEILNVIEQLLESRDFDNYLMAKEIYYKNIKDGVSEEDLSTS